MLAFKTLWSLSLTIQKVIKMSRAHKEETLVLPSHKVLYLPFATPRTQVEYHNKKPMRVTASCKKYTLWQTDPKMYQKTLQMASRTKEMAQCHQIIISVDALLTDSLVSRQLLQCIGSTAFTKSCLNTHTNAIHSRKQTFPWVAVDTLRA